MFSSHNPFSSVLCAFICGLFCTAEQKEVCIICIASFIEVSIVLLMFTFSLVSISLMSLSLLVVMLAVSLASIFIISSSIGLFAPEFESCILIVDILFTTSSCVLSLLLDSVLLVDGGLLKESALFFTISF